jgi:hypothetical protein
MTSLDEAYDSRWDRLRDPNRVGVGLVLVGFGGLAVLAAMVLVATGPQQTDAKQAAGIAAGLGIPAMLLGVVVVLPASRRNRLGVLAGVGLTVVGVALFWVAYPDRWTRTADPMAFETLAVYATGCVVGLWFVFSALASARLRNVPAGTVDLEVVREGETRTVAVSRDRYEEIVEDGGGTGDNLFDELDEAGRSGSDSDQTEQDNTRERDSSAGESRRVGSGRRRAGRQSDDADSMDRL